jgi:hypothetical protein
VNNYQSKNYWITIANKGDGELKVKNINLSGLGAPKFKIVGVQLPTAKQPLTLQKNSSISFKVNSTSAFDKSTIAKLRVVSMEDTIKEVQIDNILAIDSLSNTYTISKELNNFTTVSPVLTVYPNPNHGEPVSVSVKNLKPVEPLNIYLYNRNGRQLKVLKAIADSNGEYATTITIDNTEAVGFYLIRAVFSSSSRVAKVIVTK